MNEIDKKILSQLQEDADIPIAELSKKVNLSATPCWARINKLYKDRNKLNLKTVAFVSIRTNQHNMEWAKKFIGIISSMPEVVEFYRLSGSIDYLLKVLVPTMEEYNKFYTKLTDQIDIFSVATSFSMEEIKQTSSLPLNYV
jgi:Lrp/AsnC family transcriptional regulator